MPDIGILAKDLLTQADWYDLKQITKKLQVGKSLSLDDIRRLRRIAARAPEEPTPEQPVVTSGLAVARHFHVASRTVERWIAEGCPRTKEGHYDLRAIEKWVMERRGSAEGRDAKEGHWVTRWKAAKARLAELDYAHRRGELIERDAVERIWSREVVSLRNSLLTLPDRMAILLPAEMRVTLRNEMRKFIDGVLRTLAGMDKETPETQEPKGRPE